MATANDGSGKYASCLVTVKRLVASIELNKTSLVLFRGTSNVTETLTATVIPSNANNKALTWTSSNTSVASVSSSGVVTGKSPGTATITVLAQDGSGIKVTCKVVVKQLATSITLDKASLSLNEGEEATLIPSINPLNADDKTVEWTSSDESVVTVDESGKLKAMSKGIATIKAETKDGSGMIATCSVTVKRIVSSIVLDKTSINLVRSTSDVTELLSATIIPNDANNTAVTWTSSNTSVATVSSTGVVSGKSPGKATIMVTANDGNGAQATCTVIVKQRITSIMLDKTSLSLVIGDFAHVNIVSILPDNADDKSHLWSSSDDTIASVDENGNVTAKARGFATITVMANDGSGIFASCSIRVMKNRCPSNAVDLGLSVYWSTSNIGASSSSKHGDYFAWGELSTKSEYTWSSYKFYTTPPDQLLKYNTSPEEGTVDNKTTLELEDDVAYNKKGGSWRMPTDAEWVELRERCSCEWTKQNEVYGLKITAINGNSIFLPATGYSTGSYAFVGTDTYGYYWSSSLASDPTRAWALDISKDGAHRSTVKRYSGFAVRAVSE